MKYLILGAGPAGLTVANRLLQNGETDFLVLEKEAEAGGLCRSLPVDGSELDIGGGHFLDVRRPAVLDFLFGFMPKEEWDAYDRDSQIAINGYMINSPIEANIWQMPIKDQVRYLMAIAKAGCVRGDKMPQKFTEWIRWKLGDQIADDYMFPYNRKMFGEDLDSLGTYWLQKLPDVSFEETLTSCLEKKAYGKQPGHAQFYYPKKYGYGELWRRMAANLGDRIRYNTAVESIDYEKHLVNGTYEAQQIIVTIPWVDCEHIHMPDSIKDKINHLRFSSVVIEYQASAMDTTAHWIYYPDEELSYHRILVRHNFCPNSKGYWTETNLTRFDASGKNPANYFVNKYAYPLNTIGKQEDMQEVLAWAKDCGVIGLGRWGEWQHYNSDVVVELGMALADRIS